MDWYGLLAAIVASWCGVDIGIAIKEKDIKSIVFNAIIMVFEWGYILSNWGM